jgi:hypothetical protein
MRQPAQLQKLVDGRPPRGGYREAFQVALRGEDR